MIIPFIRSFKISYMIYNFFHKKQLEHNLPLYKKYGLNKRYYSPISSSDFELINSESREVNWEKIRQCEFYKKANEITKKSIDTYDEKGYIILKNFLSDEICEKVNQEIENLRNKGVIDFKYGNKLMFALKYSEVIRSIGKDQDLLDFLSFLLGGNAKLFQSINFINGSEQKTHSDSIHMTTFPLGGLIGLWIALEDIDQTNGALHYYPGSHKLPYYMNKDFNRKSDYFRIYENYPKYESFIEKKIEELELDKEIFNAEKGDVLIWHANILHGGEPHTDKSRTRKSMVFHYYDTNSICYHEITERPTLFEQDV